MPSTQVVRTVHPEPSLTVYHSPMRLGLALVGSVAFVAAGLWMIVSGTGMAGLGPFTVPVVGAAAVVLFGAAGVFVAWRLIQRRPALVVDRRGITDHVSAISAGFVPWEEITGLSTWSIAGETMVTVQVADPAAVLARVGPVTRVLMRANLRRFGSPSPVLLKRSCQEGAQQGTEPRRPPRGTEVLVLNSLPAQHHAGDVDRVKTAPLVVLVASLAALRTRRRRSTPERAQPAWPVVSRSGRGWRPDRCRARRPPAPTGR